MLEDEPTPDPVAEARELVLDNLQACGGDGTSCICDEIIDALIAAVRADERERCAQVAQEPMTPGCDCFDCKRYRNVAAAIRQRGEGAA
jgi:hypothetical protein